MAVPTIPSAISASAIQTEFGGSNPIAINEYYAGGSYVPSGTANATSVSIPTSGQIAYSNFSGASDTLPAGIFVRSPNCEYIGKGSCNAYAIWQTGGTAVILNASNYTWLNSGTSSTYDIRQTRTGGNYTIFSGNMANNTWVRLNINRTGALLSPALGGLRTWIANVQIKYNANSTIIDYNSMTWSAETFYTNGCPLCCFTPNTLISMADGTKKHIDLVEVGEEIKTIEGNKRVTEVIVRERFQVFKIMLNDELEINATQDHPFYVRDKGWSSINPIVDYKDIGICRELEIGDPVVGEDGEDYVVTSITEIYYPYKVYTFAESKFYANGLLVY
jgi:hypothetical protein